MWNAITALGKQGGPYGWYGWWNVPYCGLSLVIFILFLYTWLIRDHDWVSFDRRDTKIHVGLLVFYDIENSISYQVAIYHVILTSLFSGKQMAWLKLFYLKRGKNITWYVGYLVRSWACDVVEKITWYLFSSLGRD